jgi:hypothetical protein
MSSSLIGMGGLGIFTDEIYRAEDINGTPKKNPAKMTKVLLISTLRTTYGLLVLQ